MAHKSHYDSAFNAERQSQYPEVEALEVETGFTLEKARLESAARILACPVKKNPPSWAHGRIVYSKAREVLETNSRAGMLLDIGTAKGFSALMMAWAIYDSGAFDHWVVSVDMVDPGERVPRNSVKEAEGGRFTVSEFLHPFRPTGVPMTFHGGGSERLLRTLKAIPETYIPFAFVDGRHSYAAVKADGEALASIQVRGNVAIFDDVHLEQVSQAVSELKEYEFRRIQAGPMRAYAVGVRQ